MATNALDQVVGSGCATAIRADGIDAWLAADPGFSVLLFSGRSKRRPEGHDVAVAFRELVRQYGPALRLGVVADADENALMKRFGVVVLPSLVFCVGGEPVERMPRIRDWSEYADAVRRYLGAPPARGETGSAA